MTAPGLDLRAEEIGFAQSARREFHADSEGRYILALRDVGIYFDLDRVRRERSQELIGELTVRCDLPGSQTVGEYGVLVAADFNVSSLRARQDRAKLCSLRSKAAELDWYGLLEDFCQQVIAAERAGQPAVHLRDVVPAGPEAMLDVDGWRLPAEHPAVPFGPGGSLKSYLELWALGRLAQQGHRVALVDWELSGPEHSKRLRALFGHELPDVLYLRAERPLVAELDRLRRIFRDERISYAGFDSAGYANDGPPEAAEATMNLFRALRSLPGGKLVLAHTTKNAETGNQMPFGSAFIHNSARATWFVERSAESADGRIVTVALFPRKNNLGALGPAIGFEVTFDGDRVHIKRTDLSDNADFSDKLPLWQRMKGALRRGPLTMPELADETGAKLDTIIKTVSRSNGRMFVKVPGTDGKTRIALVGRTA